MDLVDADGLISDDSGFYGDDDLKNEFTRKDRMQSPETFTTYFSYYEQLPAVMARQHIDAQPKPRANPELLNPYRDLANARQLGESVDDFVNRLRPSQATEEEVGPWILVANPHVEQHPLENDLAGLGEQGTEILNDYTELKTRLESEGKSKFTIGKYLKPQRDALPQRILDVARKCNVTAGKWMLFPSVNDVDLVWKKVAEAVVDNKLGTSAKVRTTGGRDASERLICVYTADFGDERDVRRVLNELVNLGLIRSKTLGDIYYKCDAYTHLGIDGKNELGIRASMYSSAFMLKATNTRPRTDATRSNVAGAQSNEVWDF